MTTEATKETTLTPNTRLPLYMVGTMVVTAIVVVINLWEFRGSVDSKLTRQEDATNRNTQAVDRLADKVEKGTVSFAVVQNVVEAHERRQSSSEAEIKQLRADVQRIDSAMQSLIQSLGKNR